MSRIWNKVVVLGLAAALSAPVLAADDATANKAGQDQTQAQAMPQDGSAAATQDGKQEGKKEAKGKHGKHKHHHKGSKEKAGNEAAGTTATSGTEAAPAAPAPAAG